MCSPVGPRPNRPVPPPPDGALGLGGDAPKALCAYKGLWSRLLHLLCSLLGLGTNSLCARSSLLQTRTLPERNSVTNSQADNLLRASKMWCGGGHALLSQRSHMIGRDMQRPLTAFFAVQKKLIYNGCNMHSFLRSEAVNGLINMSKLIYTLGAALLPPPWLTVIAPMTPRAATPPINSKLGPAHRHPLIYHQHCRLSRFNSKFICRPKVRYIGVIWVTLVRPLYGIYTGLNCLISTCHYGMLPVERYTAQELKY